MATKQFVELTSDLIDEGEFIAALDESLVDVMRSLVAFRKKNGPRAHKAKACITAKIELVCTDVENGAYVIHWKMDQSLPKRPTQSSFAVEGDDATLFVRTSGSDDSHPAQMKFATKDGRNIDPETQEPLE